MKQYQVIKVENPNSIKNRKETPTEFWPTYLKYEALRIAEQLEVNDRKDGVYNTTYIVR